MSAKTVVHSLFEQAARRPDAAAYHVKVNGSWVPTSWRNYVREIRRAARALIALGCEPGSTINLLGFNKPEWVIADVAAMAVGGAPAGIYTTSSAPDIRYIVTHSEARVLFLENRAQWDKIAPMRAELKQLHRIVMFRDSEPIDHPDVLTWDAFLALGDSVADEEVDRRMAALRGDQLATLIYTSGTTGPPKGVMLSHGSLMWTAQTCVDMTGIGPTDCAVSYLPLSHIAEQMFSIHAPATAGFTLYFAESLDKLRDNIVEVQPSVFFGVPRVWEKFYTGIQGRLAQATGAKKVLLDWARGVGRQMSAVSHRGETPGAVLALQYKIASKLVFSKLKPAVGMSRARMCVSGAAPISPEIIDFFSSLDIRIYEVYGQSEGSGPTSFNQPGATRIGTVGKPIPGCQVTFGSDGEILVGGPNVFMGYFKDPAATAETLVNGVLHSGDLGEFDANGFLKITGRKKDIIITAGGKNIAPKNLENDLKNHPLINEAVMIGDRRKFLTMLLTLDPDTSAAFAAEHNIPIDQLPTHPRLLAEIQSTIDEANTHHARVEQIKKFTVLPRNLTVEDNELTPTMKVKRKNVATNWADAIEAMYAGDTEG
jgi:long-chain acyl-CoA synthetase